MKNLTIAEILKDEPLDKIVKFSGWVRSLRKSKKFSFVVINDGSCQASLQVVIDADLKNYDDVTACLTGSALEVEGKVVASGGKGQKVEIHAVNVQILGEASSDYPLQKKATSMEFLREKAHLRVRTNTFGAVFRIRHALSQATHQFFSQRGFVYVHTPIITAIDAEGAGEMFQVTTLPIDQKKNERLDFSQDYFGKRTMLTVSGQLNAECLALGLGKVYTFGPTFRSENSNTSRHLSEFWMVEPEMAFVDLEGDAKYAKDYLKALASHLLEYCSDEIEFLNNRPEREGGDLFEKLTSLKESSFEKITYTEAIDILQKSSQKFEFSPVWGQELQTEHERYLAEKHFGRPVIVIDYPKDCKAFYMKQNSDGKTVGAMDVLVPGVGEIIGGSQREEDLDKLLQRIQEIQMDETSLSWYLDLRRYGSVVHSGFGLGLERAIMYMTGMSNIRDVTCFARTPRNAEF